MIRANMTCLWSKKKALANAVGLRLSFVSIKFDLFMNIFIMI